MRVHLAGVTSAHRESGGAGCGTAGVPRLGWAAMMRLLWPQRRLKAPCRGGRTLLGGSFQGSSSSRRRRLRRTLIGLGATQPEHLERRVLLAGDSFDSGMNTEAWAMATYEPSAEVCVPTGEWEFSSPSSNGASFSYEPTLSEPVSFEPVSFSYSDTRCESAAPMDTVPTVEPSNVSETSEPGIGYGWMGGNKTAAAESPARIADGFASAQSSDATDQMASGAAADTQDGDTSPVAFAQAGHPDDTGADPAEGCPGVGPVAEPSPSEVPRTPLNESVYEDYVLILHLTRMASAEDAPHATVTQEHKFIVVSSFEFPVIPEAPHVCPGPGWRWVGEGPPGSKNGHWEHDDRRKLHPDLDHPEGKAPHWGLKFPGGNEWEYFPETGEWKPKGNLRPGRPGYSPPPPATLTDFYTLWLEGGGWSAPALPPPEVVGGGIGVGIMVGGGFIIAGGYHFGRYHGYRFE
jgi:hypothetical protein